MLRRVFQLTVVVFVVLALIGAFTIYQSAAPIVSPFVQAAQATVAPVVQQVQANLSQPAPVAGSVSVGQQLIQPVVVKQAPTNAPPPTARPNPTATARPQPTAVPTRVQVTAPTQPPPVAKCFSAHPYGGGDPIGVGKWIPSGTTGFEFTLIRETSPNQPVLKIKFDGMMGAKYTVAQVGTSFAETHDAYEGIVVSGCGIGAKARILRYYTGDKIWKSYEY